MTEGFVHEDDVVVLAKVFAVPRNRGAFAEIDDVSVGPVELVLDQIRTDLKSAFVIWQVSGFIVMAKNVEGADGNCFSFPGSFLSGHVFFFFFFKVKKALNFSCEKEEKVKSEIKNSIERRIKIKEEKTEKKIEDLFRCFFFPLIFKWFFCR